MNLPRYNWNKTIKLDGRVGISEILTYEFGMCLVLF